MPTYRARCIVDGLDRVNYNEVYICKEGQSYVRVYREVPGSGPNGAGEFLGWYNSALFQRLEEPQATTPPPTPPEAPVAPSEPLQGGVKFDTGKPRMDLLPPEALVEIATVLGVGAEKYSAHNWRGGFAYSRLIAAALRHIFAWVSGEDTDPESKKSHLAHAACCLMFLITFEKTGTGTDDRYTTK